MKALIVSKSLLATFATGLITFGINTQAAEEPDGTTGRTHELAATPAAPLPIPKGPPTYRVGYMYSTTTSPRRAMAISITNNSSQSCSTTVKWLAGGGQLIGTSTIVVPAGETLEHCSRTISGATVICNGVSSPEVAPPQFIEGKADIFIAASCANLVNIDAKQYYMAGTDDGAVTAVHRAATIRGNEYKGD